MLLKLVMATASLASSQGANATAYETVCSEPILKSSFIPAIDFSDAVFRYVSDDVSVIKPDPFLQLDRQQAQLRQPQGISIRNSHDHPLRY